MRFRIFNTPLPFGGAFFLKKAVRTIKFAMILHNDMKMRKHLGANVPNEIDLVSDCVVVLCGVRVWHVISLC